MADSNCLHCSVSLLASEETRRLHLSPLDVVQKLVEVVGDVIAIAPRDDREVLLLNAHLLISQLASEILTDTYKVNEEEAGVFEMLKPKQEKGFNA